jgi:hypothetical protein
VDERGTVLVPGGALVLIPVVELVEATNLPVLLSEEEGWVRFRVLKPTAAAEVASAGDLVLKWAALGGVLVVGLVPHRERVLNSVAVLELASTVVLMMSGVPNP